MDRSRRIASLILLLVIAAASMRAVAQSQGTEHHGVQKILVLFCEFEDDIGTETEHPPYTVAEATDVMDSLDSWWRESSMDHDADSSLSSLDVTYIDGIIVPGDGLGTTLTGVPKAKRAITAAVDSGHITVDSLLTFDRVLFGWSRPLGFPRFTSFRSRGEGTSTRF